MSRLAYFTFCLSVIPIVTPTDQVSNENVTRRVNYALPHAHPYQVSIRVAYGFLLYHDCAGAILTETWVLSTSHCINNWWFTMTPPIAVAGQLYQNDEGEHVQRRGCARVIPHPNHKDGMGSYDIGLLELYGSFDFNPRVLPAKLPQGFAPALSAGRLVMVGWGSVSSTELPQSAGKVQTTALDVLSYEECISSLPRWPNVRELVNPRSNICTRGPTSCSADSGLPVVLLAPKRQPLLIGLFSWGLNPCGLANAPSIHTNVSHFMDFIKKYVGTIPNYYTRRRKARP